MLKYHVLLETEYLTEQIFDVINPYIVEQGLLLRQVALIDLIIDATAPSSKNKKRLRNPNMHETKKSDQGFLRVEERF